MPPAYEVLLLNTAIPQIQAAQAGDTYVVPRDIAFSAALTLSAGTANGVPYLNGSKVVTTGSALTFDGTNLGVGIASPAAPVHVAAFSSGGKALRINGRSADNYGEIQFYDNAGTTSYVSFGAYGSAAILQTNTNIPWIFGVNGSEEMRLNSSGLEVKRSQLIGYSSFAGIGSNGLAVLGNVGIGTSSPSTKLQIEGGAGAAWLRATNTTNTDGTYVGTASTGEMNVYQAGSFPIVFHTASTERARITSGGYFKASNTGTYTGSTGAYHEFNSNFSDYVVWTKNSVASGPFGIRVQYSAATPNGTGNEFLVCDDSTAVRMTVRSNGGIANYSANDVNLASDERLKKDISPLESTWDKLKAVEVVNFRYKDCNEGDPLLFGVIAQQVQPIVPDLVVVTKEAQEAVQAKDAVLDADGNVVEPAIAAKEATPEYYGIREQPMYWLAIKALQEAMARIETLEAEVAALKGA